MDKQEQLKNLNYPVVVECGIIKGEDVEDFQEWLFHELVSLDMIKEENQDIINMDAMVNKYGGSYIIINNETELLENFELEELEF